MAEQETRKTGGGKLSRSETVTVRLDPKLRYLAELAARKQRRTLSSYIEWVIEESLTVVRLSETKSLKDEARELWDVDEADRFFKLKNNHPELLTFEEQVLAKVMADAKAVHMGTAGPSPEMGDWAFSLWIRKHWETLKKMASGEMPRDHFPPIDDWQTFRAMQAERMQVRESVQAMRRKIDGEKLR